MSHSFLEGSPIRRAREAVHRALMGDGTLDHNELAYLVVHAGRLVDDLANLDEWQTAARSDRDHAKTQ